MATKRRDFPSPGGAPGSKAAAIKSSGTPPSPDVAELDRDGLLLLWRAAFGTTAPKGMSLGFLRRFLAFELQARQQGGVPASLRARLGRIDAGKDRAATPALKTGGRLLREWNGVTHVIDVTPEGYLWQGRRHRSLSAIARAITGAQWSGPRFFGLTVAEAGMPGKAAPTARRRRINA